MPKEVVKKGIVKKDSFSEAVTEYQIMENKVSQDFLSGIIKLGEILARHREVWKRERRWEEYVGAINKTLPQVNQFIRIFEYSKENLKKLVGADITNWGKLNMFLALPEPLRDKLAEDIQGEELTTDQYREKISGLKDEEVTVVEVNEEEIPIEDENLSELVAKSSLSDTLFLAKQLIKEFNKSGKNFSNNCVPIADGFLSMERALRELQKENFKKLTPEEKKFWKKVILQQIDRVNSILK